MNSAIAIEPITSSQFLSVCNYITSFGIFLNNLGLIKIDERNQTVPVLNALFEYLNKFENQSEPKIQLLQTLLKETVHYFKGKNATVINMKVAEKHYHYIINTALFSHYGYITGYLEEIIDKTENITSSILKQKVLQHLPGSYINDQCSLAKGSLKLTLLATERIFRDYILPEFTETWVTRSLSKGPTGDFQIKRTKRNSPLGLEDSALSTSDDSSDYLDMMSSISRNRGRLDLQSPFSDIGINAFGTGCTARGRLDLQSPLSDIGNNALETRDTARGRLYLQSPLSDIENNAFGTRGTVGGRSDLQSPLSDIWNNAFETRDTAGGRLYLQSPLSHIENNAFGTGGTGGGRFQHDTPPTSWPAFENIVNNQVEEQITTRMHTIKEAANFMSSTNCGQFEESEEKSIRILKSYILRLRNLEANMSSAPTYHIFVQDYCKYGPKVLDFYKKWKIKNRKYIDDVLFEKKFYVPEHLSGPVFEIKQKYGQRYIRPLANIAFEQYKNKLPMLQTKLRFEDFYYLRHGLMKECNIPDRKGDPNKQEMLAAIYRLALRQCNEERSDNRQVNLYQATVIGIHDSNRLKLLSPGNEYHSVRFKTFSKEEVRHYLVEPIDDSLLHVLCEFKLEEVCGIADLSSIGTFPETVIPEDRYFSLFNMNFTIIHNEYKIIYNKMVLEVKMMPSKNISKESRMVNIAKALDKILSKSKNLYMDEN